MRFKLWRGIELILVEQFPPLSLSFKVFVFSVYLKYTSCSRVLAEVLVVQGWMLKWLWWRVLGLPGEQAGSAMGQWAGGDPAAVFCAFSPVSLPLSCYLHTSAYVPLPLEALLFILWAQSQLCIQTQVYTGEGPAAGQAGHGFGCCSLQWAGLTAGRGMAQRAAHGGERAQVPLESFQAEQEVCCAHDRAGGVLGCSDCQPLALLGIWGRKGNWFLREMKLTQKVNSIVRRNSVYT